VQITAFVKVAAGMSDKWYLEFVLSKFFNFTFSCYRRDHTKA